MMTTRWLRRTRPAPLPAQRGRPNAMVVAAACVLGFVIVAAFVGPFFVQDPSTQQLDIALTPPAWVAGGTWEHPLGTDSLGRDELARVLYGARVSLGVSMLSLLVGATFGIAIGVLAGYLRGVFDQVVMRIVDVQMSVPGILFILTVVTILKPSFTTIIIVLALAVWIMFARVSRAQVLSFRENDTILAIRSIGASSPRILLRHVVPNIAGPLLIVATLELATLIMAEAALGYLGLGVPPPTPTLGSMISSGQSGMTSGAWWPVVVPGLSIALIIITINILGDWLRDVLDPRGVTK